MGRRGRARWLWRKELYTLQWGGGGRAVGDEVLRMLQIQSICDYGGDLGTQVVLVIPASLMIC